MADFSSGDVYNAAVAAGFAPGNQAATITAIIERESSNTLNPAPALSYNPDGSPGEYHYGPGQQSQTFMAGLGYPPNKPVFFQSLQQAMNSIYAQFVSAGRNFSPWTNYNVNNPRQTWGVPTSPANVLNGNGVPIISNVQQWVSNLLSGNPSGQQIYQAQGGANAPVNSSNPALPGLPSLLGMNIDPQRIIIVVAGAIAILMGVWLVFDLPAVAPV